MAARATAVLIDGVLTFAGLGTLVAAVAGEAHHSGGSFGFHLDGWPALIWLVLAFGYWIVCEYIWGATVGKRIFSIRVEASAGGRPTFVQAVARNLFRLIDGFPFVLPYLVGFIVAKCSAERTRLGDMVAHTRVVASS
jgi:uncharacterized RDD family membrane protein YckC